MTKKDYEQIAIVFGNLYADIEAAFANGGAPRGAAILLHVENARREMQSVLKSDNSRFDADRFHARVLQIAEAR